MSTFEYACKVCQSVVAVKGRIGQVPRNPMHCGRKMRRMYCIPKFQITWGIADYANRAYDGDEVVPGMTQQEVRATIDTMKVTS